MTSRERLDRAVKRIQAEPHRVFTAAQLGVTAKALRAEPGVEAVDVKRTGFRGRPAILFRAR